MSNSKNYLAKAQAVSSYPLDSESVDWFLLSVAKTIELSRGYTNRPSYSKLSRDTFGYVANSFESLMQLSTLSEDQLKQMDAILKKIDKDFSYNKKNSWGRDQIGDCRNSIKNYKPVQVFDYLLAIDSAESTKEVDALADKFTKDANMSNHWSSGTASNILMSFARNKFISPDKFDSLLSDNHYGWYIGQNIKKLTNDPIKLGIIASHFGYIGINSILKNSSNPILSFKELIRRRIKQGVLYLEEDLTSSSYFTDEIALEIPLKIIYNTEHLSGLFNSKIIATLKDKLKSPESWDTFENLVEEFEGTTLELIDVSNNI